MLEDYLNQNFGGVKAKHSSVEALKRWRDACGLVRNSKRRFRFTANIEKRNEAADMRRTNQVCSFIQNRPIGGNDQCRRYSVPEEFREAGYGIGADDASSIFEGLNSRKLKTLGGVDGMAEKLLTSTTNGLTMENGDLIRRQQLFGTNEFTERGRSFWVFIFEAFQDMTLYVLTMCAFLSLIVGITPGGWQTGAYDGLGLVACIMLVVFVTAINDYHQSLQFWDLDKEKKRISIQVTRNGYIKKLSIDELLPGDIAHLRIGDLVPADGLFLSGYSLVVDQSRLTGESKPVEVNAENPYLLSGTAVRDGCCNMLVVAVGMRTQWGKLMATLTEGGNDETPLQVKLNGVATIIGKIGLIFAILTFAVLAQKLFASKVVEGTQWSWSADDALNLLAYFAIAVATVVVAVPEGLSLAVTLSLAFAMKKMMNDKALVRNLAACETMGFATTICSDKTGTLTTNHMTVVKSCICLNVNKEEIPDSAKKILVQSIFTNTGGEVVVNKEGKREILGSPTDTAILEFGLSLGGDFQSERQSTKVLRVEPFNSTKKQMGVVLELPEGGVRAHCKGASEIVLAACDKVINENGEVVALDEESLNRLKSTIDSFAGEALRTLCLAYIDLESGFSAETPIPSYGYTCIGIVGIEDPVRPGVKEAVARCRSAGITVRMVTGDNITTAKAIARECGILTDDGIAIEAPDFSEKSPEELLEKIPKIQVMARSSPLDKQTLVKHLRKTVGEVVAVTGDGINDAPTLHEADIGLAMGIAGTEVAKESADVIILDDSFSTIFKLTRWGRSVYVNIQKILQFQLTVNIVALMVNFTSACLTGSVPLTAVQLLWVNLIMDTLGALALASEPPTDELMKRTPVGRMANFVSNVMWRNIFGQAVFQIAVIWLLQSKGKSFFSLVGENSDVILNTVIFNSFVFFQLFNMVNSREMEKEDVLDGLWKNKIFASVIAATVVFQVLIVEYLGPFANTVPLTATQWWFSVFTGFLSMPIAVFFKRIPVCVTSSVAKPGLGLYSATHSIASTRINQGSIRGSNQPMQGVLGVFGVIGDLP